MLKFALVCNVLLVCAAAMDEMVPLVNEISEADPLHQDAANSEGFPFSDIAPRQMVASRGTYISTPPYCPSPEAVCPSKLSLLAVRGYEYVEGHGFYRISRSQKTWLTSKEICEKEGSHLLILNSLDETNAVRELAVKNGGVPALFAVGVHDQYREGNFVTIFNQSLASTGYQTWFTSQPNGGTAENCMGIQFSTTNGLADFRCTSNEFYICEYN